MVGHPASNVSADVVQADLAALLSESIDAATNRERRKFDALSAPLSDSLVLFGAGRLGRKTLAGLRSVGVEPLAFADNSASLWGQTVDGLEVLSAEDAAGRYAARATFVVTIWRAGGGHRFSHTRQQLRDLGCLRVVSFAFLFWKYPSVFLPYYAIDRPSALLSQAQEITNASMLWADRASHYEYLAQVRWRLELDFDGLPSPIPYAQYFPDDVLALSSSEVFVDCGAYDGDTLRVLFERRPHFAGQVIALEPDPTSLERLHEYTATLPDYLRERVTVLAVAVGARRETLRFSATGTAESAVSAAGDLVVNCVSLDEVLSACEPTYIKMDIEGAELSALSGARGVIQRSLPVLAICVYHRPDHLWRIPLYIRSLSDDYLIFLRPHNEEGWDLVCYAVPSSRVRVAPYRKESYA